MDPTAQVINPDVMTALVNSGHIWVFVAIACVNVVIIPLAGFLWKHFEHKHQQNDLMLIESQKRLIDAERKATGYERDKQFAEIDSRITKLHTDSMHKDDEQDIIVGNLRTEIERLHEEIKLLKDHYFEKRTK